MKRALFWLLPLLALPLSCKDEDPCDPGQEARGTGCYPVEEGEAGSPGTPSGNEGGAADGAGGAGSEPTGNPDATFGTKCESDEDCGGDAPVCATEMLFYCTQLDCQDGEANAGACPDGWSCIKVPEKPSACVNLSAL